MKGSSLSVLLGGVLVAVMLIACLEYLLASGQLWNLELGRLVSHQHDDWTYALQRMKRAARQQQVDGRVFLFGGSSAREAISSNEEASVALSAIVQTPIEFVNFGTRNQTLAESVVLIENLPDATQSVVVFALQPMFLADEMQDVFDAYNGIRYPLESDALAQLLVAHEQQLPALSPAQVVRYRPRIANFLRSRIRLGFNFSSIPYANRLYAGLGSLPLDALRIQLVGVARHMQTFDSNTALNLDVLRAGVRLARAKGYQVVLAGLPRNPIADRSLLARYLPHYLAEIRRLADDEGVEFVDFHPRLALPSRAFFDHVHILDETRPKLERALFDVVVDQLKAS